MATRLKYTHYPRLDLGVSEALGGASKGDNLRAATLKITGQAGATCVFEITTDGGYNQSLDNTATTALAVLGSETEGSGNTAATFDFAAASTVDLTFGYAIRAAMAASMVRADADYVLGTSGSQNLAVRAAVVSSKLRLTFRDAGGAFDLTALGAGEIIEVQMTYITAPDA